jgi:hypothetical protein
VAIDYTALLGVTAGVPYTKLTYDKARDGGAVGTHSLVGEPIPVNAVPVAYAVYETTTIVQSDNPTNEVGTPDTGTLLDLVAGDMAKAGWITLAASAPQMADRPVDFYIVTNPITAGAFTLWIFYLPI